MIKLALAHKFILVVAIGGVAGLGGCATSPVADPNVKHSHPTGMILHS